MDVGQLAPCDIILTASPGQATSAIIRALTNSDFSHAVLVAELPYAVESADYGVVKFRLDRFAVRDPRNIAVRRLRRHLQSRFDCAEALGFAKRMTTREYADYDVLTTLFSRVPRLERGTFFCSHLVCAAYDAGGIPLTDRPPEKVSPGMLAESPLVEEVPLQLIEVDTRSLPYQPAFLDGPNPQSPAESETLARQEAFRLACPIFSQYGIDVVDFADAFQRLLKAWRDDKSFVPDLDRTFAEALRESGLVDLPQEIAPADSDSFFLEYSIRHAIVFGGMSFDQQQFLLEFYKRELSRIRSTNAERDSDVTTYKKMYLAAPLESVRLQLAAVWQVFLSSMRMQYSVEQAVEVLEISLRER